MSNEQKAERNKVIAFFSHAGVCYTEEQAEALLRYTRDVRADALREVRDRLIREFDWDSDCAEVHVIDQLAQGEGE